MKYCTYLTTYRGNKLPPFYIGSTSIERINNGYRGSVESKSYKQIWIDEIKNNPHLFRTIILTSHNTRKEATEKEFQFQLKLLVHRNSLYINKSIGGIYFDPELNKRFGKDNPAFGKKRPDLRNNNKKRAFKLMVFDKDWNYVETTTVSNFCQRLNIRTGNVNMLAKNWKIMPDRTMGGFKFCYQHDYDNSLIESFKLKGHSGRTPIYQYDSNNNLICRFSSIKEAANATGIGFDNIYKCFKGKQQTAGGFKWQPA